jgi:NAD-dependent deacetylase
MPRPPSIVVLTGAGISADSGLATFRDAGGIWAKHRIEDVATPEAFARDPARVHAFYNARRAQLADPAIAPNAAHAALAAFDAAWPGEFLLVTQNVDDLHDRAGSRRLVHMHGQLSRIRCTACGDARDWRGDLTTDTACPSCGRTGTLRPDVVWFGEMPLHMPRIAAALDACDLFVAIGTSAQVYPAAGFVAELRGRARTVELNLEPTAATALFDEARHGRAVDVVPPFFASLLAEHGAA